MPKIHPPPAERTRRSLVLGIGVLIAAGVFLWRWEHQEPSFFTKLTWLVTGHKAADETSPTDAFARR